MNVLARYEDLAGRRALVTGASSGIGLGCAEALLAQGARVALQYHTRAAPAEALAARHPGRAVAIRAELGLESGCTEAVRAAASALGGLDVLVHAAGIWNAAPIATLAASQLDEMFRVNAFSAFYLVRDALPHLRAGPSAGAVVLVGSTAGERGEAGHSHYAASKGALQALTMSLAVELAPEVRVNLVSPGWVRTPMAEAELGSPIGRAIVSTTPNRRVAEVDDVVHAVLYLASEASGHVVGQVLGVSGGALLVVPRGQLVPRE